MGFCLQWQVNSLLTYLTSPGTLKQQIGGPGIWGQGDENVDEDPSRFEGFLRARQHTPHIKTSSIKKKRRVVVIGDSLLRGMDGPKCQMDPAHMEACEPWRNHQETSQLGMPTDYCPLVFQMDTYNVPTRLRMIKRDLTALGQLVKDLKKKLCSLLSCQLLSYQT